MIPDDYAERVYAGVLGKMIGVYLGRPFEGWSYEKIMAELGEITGYVHDRLGQPLIITDDDLTGTFTFLRALTDHGGSLELTPEQIGQTWLNYIIQNRTILWWGGVGHSTEHTAYTRLKAGIPAPLSGAIETNGKIIAEQIGSQIFIDGWGMVAPGDPELAADLARRAASVSHDGEGIYGAQVIAAMVAQAFVESDIDLLLETAVSLIPPDSTVFRLISDIREFHGHESDWRKARAWLAGHYGYDKFGGNCHIIPNHGLIVLSLLYGDDDFRQSLMIVNTSGWDTDCNSGNVGCLLGIKQGLAGIETIQDLRQPLNDRLYLPTAEGGRAITDAVQETYHIVNTGLILQNKPTESAKAGARFHFSLPGSVQNFRTDAQSVDINNVMLPDKRVLALTFNEQANEVFFIGTDTFIPPEAINMPGYELLASPTLYPGQRVSASLMADPNNTELFQAGLYLRYYGKDDLLVRITGPQLTFAPGRTDVIQWQIPEIGCQPIAEIGVMIHKKTAVPGTFYLDYLTWTGEPSIHWQKSTVVGRMWSRAWVDGVDHYYTGFPELFRIAQNSGRGLLMNGTREWQNISVEAQFAPHMVKQFGLAVRVQGLQCYYALLLDQIGHLKIACVYDGEERVLAETTIEWDGERSLPLSLHVYDHQLHGFVDGACVITAVDQKKQLACGGIALVIEEGCVCVDDVAVSPSNEPRVLA